MQLSRYATYAWSVLVYNILVILWGAFVRATESGAGCGAHWPKCNGEVIPRAPAVETMIEFSHRMTTALAGFLVIGLVIWAFRAFTKSHPVRWAAGASLALVVLEGLVGAVQVRLGLTGENASPMRAVIGSIHLVNTFFLLAALTWTAWWASGGKSIRLQGAGVLGWTFGVSFALTILLGVSGAITALGDTLFPVDSLAVGIQQDFSPEAHFLIQLRIWHPVLAILTGALLIAVTFHADRQRPDKGVRPFAYFLTGIYIVQLLIGAFNLALLAPVWMQLTHLLFAVLVWIALVLTATKTFATTELAPHYAERPALRKATVS
jgi:heme A synthase